MNHNTAQPVVGTEKAAPALGLSILFVDDEEMVLRMLRAAVASLEGQWQASYANSGAEALELLGKQPFDIVVSDMRMPGMTGAQLLNEVFRLYPATFRVILTGYVQEQRVMESVGTAHQFLSKPFELHRLKDLLYRTANLRSRLRNEPVRTIVSGTASVPSVPTIYFEILNALQAPDCPAEAIADIVTTDPGLTSKVLQLVNSAFFGVSSEVSNAKEAVLLLGTGTIRALALTCGLFSAFPVQRDGGFSIDQLWSHSLLVARIAERICRFEQTNTAVIEQAFTAGVLHDMGKLMLAHALPSQYLPLLRQALAEPRRLSELEQASLGTTHPEAGACLLQLWGLPSSLTEAVLWHEQPQEAPADGLGPTLAVTVANVLAYESTASANNSSNIMSSGYLQKLGLTSRLELWRQHCVD